MFSTTDGQTDGQDGWTTDGRTEKQIWGRSLRHFWPQIIQTGALVGYFLSLLVSPKAFPGGRGPGGQEPPTGKRYAW